ncbi:MAG: hypothetical protein NC191_00265, partial [Muribaculaceae bacterium]|nr:hypothetical protein [Muribaculaceae bacterium]
QSALSLIVEDYGYAGCYVSLYYNEKGGYYGAEIADCNPLKQQLISTLKLQKFDTEVNKKYTALSDVLAKGGKATNISCSFDYYQSIAEPYVSLDGTLYWLYKDDSQPWIIIDVNNEKGPNKWGYDVFWMTLSNKNEKLLLTDEYCSLIEKGGKFPRTIIKSQKSNPENISTSW